MNTTIIERMREHVHARPEAIAFRYLNDLSSTPEELNFRQLWEEAGAIAQFLRTSAPTGSRVMLLFQPGLAYIRAFYGCLIAGMIAVPLYPPRRNVKSDRIIKVAQSCQSTLALTTEPELCAVELAWDEQNTEGRQLRLHAVDAITGVPGQVVKASPVDADAAAFLQYTSGSTGIPKGVIVTHNNIAANATHLSLMSTGNGGDIFVNWLPLFHDLGLVTAVLWPVWLGATSILMAPATFVRKPALWLKAITRYRGTMCGAPNFAFELCAAKVSDTELADIDLSSWRIAYNAAEPVRATTLDKFAARFGASGFRPQAFYPSYGMAEATVFISGGDAAAHPITLTVDQRALADFHLGFVGADHPDATRIVACGAAYAPHDMRVVHPDTMRAQPDGAVGEIWFAGPSVSPGYWEQEALTRETFGQRIANDDSSYRYLRTGDLGVMHEGQVYVTGRIKDLIILRGRNYYPQDIEASAASAHPAVRPGHVAAFAASGADGEQMVVAELEREHFRAADPEGIFAAIRRQVMLDHEVNVDRLVLLRPYRIPMTSSGKIQRRQTRDMLNSDSLDVLAQSSLAGERDARAITLPATPTEHILSELLRSILALEQIGVHDNLFEVGADSIALAEAAGRARQRFPQLDIQASHFFDWPTIASLGSWIDLQTAHQASRRNDTSDLRTITI
jgi:acyl-CoA synthetase (AMP-forming)/AMP-acid ligase II/aryl carrier-like protein